MKFELINDHFENAKRYNIPRAQLIIADIPYNLGNNAYASDPRWYKDGDNKNGESRLAGKSFFDTDNDFKINNFFDFCSRLLKKEPKEKGKAPEFNNGGAMILNHAPWEKDSSYPVIHPTQKPIPVLKRLIEIFTDEGDVVIDPVAGSGSTLRAAIEMNRSAYGFEIKKDFYKAAQEKMLSTFQTSLF